MTRRLAALALTIVLAPTIVWTVFNGLRGTGGQPLYDVAFDYVVATFWGRPPVSPAPPGRAPSSRARSTWSPPS